MSKALDLEKEAYKALLRKRKPYNYQAPKLPSPPMQRASSARPMGTNDVVSDILNNRNAVTPQNPTEDKQDFWGSVGEGIGDFVNTPVIKSAIDMLSTGGYATANSIDQALTGGKRVAQGDLGGLGQIAAAPIVGLGKGFSGGFGGNQNDTLTYSKLMDKHLGEVDEEDTAGKWIRGGAGFAGDVLLDPTTYLTLGGAAAVKAGVKGAQLTKAQLKTVEKLGPEAVNAPIKYKTKREAYAKEYAGKRAEQKLEKREAAAHRKIKKLVKKGKVDPKDVETLVEEVITGLEPAVALRNIDENADKVKTLSRKFEDKNPEVAAAITAPTDVANAVSEVGGKSASIPDIVDEVIDPKGAESRLSSVGNPNVDVAPAPKLDEISPVTPAQRLVKELDDVRVPGPDTKTKVSTESLDEKALVDFLNNHPDPIKISNGSASKAAKPGPNLAVDITKGGYRRTRAINGLPQELLDNFKVITETEKLVPSTEFSGRIADIADKIWSGKVKPTTGLKALAGTDDPKAIADFILNTSKGPEWGEAVKSMRNYSQGSRLKPRTPTETATRASAQASMPTRNFSREELISAQNPLSVEESLTWREAKYAQVSTELANHRFAKEMREYADKIFGDAIGLEKLNDGLKTEHASIKHLDKLIYEANKLAPKSLKTQDSIIMGVIRDVDNRLRLAGIEPYLQNVAARGDNLVVRLAPSDVLDLLTSAQRTKLLWGKDEIHKVLPTTILDLAEVLIRGTTRLTPEGKIDYPNALENAIQVLQGTKGLDSTTRLSGKADPATYEKNLEQIIATVAGKDSKAYKDFIAPTYVDEITGNTLKNTHARKLEIADTIRAVNPEKYMKVAQDRMNSSVVDLLKSFTDGWKEGKATILTDLVNTNMRNAAVFSGTISKKIDQVSTEHMGRLKAAMETGTPDEFIHELVTKPPFPWKGKTDPVTKKLREDARRATIASVTNKEELRHLEASAKNVADADKPVNSQKAAKNNAEAYQTNPEADVLADKIAKGTPTEDDLERVIELATRENNADIIMRAFGSQRYFNARAGMGITYETVTASAHAATHIMTGFHNILKDWGRRGIGKEEVRVAFKLLQSGEENLPPFAQELQDVLKFMFSSTNESGAPISNFLTRNTVGPAHFNRVLRGVGFDNKIRVDEDATPAEMAVAWKEWEVENPVDFFSKMMHAMLKTTEDVSIGASITRKFGKAEYQPGYAKVKDTSKQNQLVTLIDKDLYYPVEVIDEFTVVNQFMTASRSFDPKSPMGTFITQAFDPVVSTLKLTQTTMKPGHHIMSIIGDAWRNHLAGVKSQDYKKAIRVLHSNRGSMKGFEPLEQWAKVKEQLHGNSITGADISRAETMVFHGRAYKVSHSEIYKIAKQKGAILPAHIGSTDLDELADFRTLDDSTGNAITRGIKGTASRIDRLANPNHGKYSLNAFTASRDNISRMSLFMRFMQEKPFKTMDEAADYAANELRKWAPTAADLGAFEAKYMRRGIFYYTWLRGMIPRILESSLTRPGVATIPSKLMYNMAAANGLDPMSIGDPFPEGTLFPEWYQERVLGPQWQNENDLWGFNPTGPVMDVLNSIGSGVTPKDIGTAQAPLKFGNTALGMSTPWIKAPIEVITGRRLDGGAPIDRPEYLQDMIGPARVASRMIGKNFIPGMDAEGDIGLPNRSSSKYRGGLGDDFWDNFWHEAINWGSGLQFTNYTSDQSDNSAQFQERDKLIKERRLNERFGG